MSAPRVAIVGMACRYPDADGPAALWENVLACRRSFRRIPPERLSAPDYFSTDLAMPDRTYAFQAALLDGWVFDRVRFRVAGTSYRAADLAHWLALEVAADALADAGYPDGAGLPRETTGVLIGNTLTGEFSRAQSLRLRWPYVRRVTEASLREGGVDGETRARLLAALEARFKAPFPEVGEETLAGGLSNTIAGRICNTFDLHGGGYTVDGACSSSLLAVANACSSLACGDLDVAIAGGVDLSLDPFELVGFAKTGALAPEEMRVYDERSQGFWPGEGSGAVVLMRLDDAERGGRRVHAVIRGWGVSSDGAGGLTRPEAHGQIFAVRRAYARAGYDIDSVAYIEGHGTGTAVGDATELRMLDRARREAGARVRAVVGSVKANIGHTKAAAGVAGLLKAAHVVGERTIPPNTGVERPHPAFEPENGGDPLLRIAREGEDWPLPGPARAGVSSMGFGGINVHLTLEERLAARGGAPSGRGLSPRARRLARSAQDTEILLLGAPARSELAEVVGRLREIVPGLSRAELSDLATASVPPVGARVRAAIVASTPEAMSHGLERVATALEARGPGALVSGGGVYFGEPLGAPRIAFLFPGQGSPSHVDGGAIARRFEPARALYPEGISAPHGPDEVWTAVAQPAIARASLATRAVLEACGVSADVATGHSLGELAALCWAGALSEAATIGTARARGRAMAAVTDPPGAMASLEATPERALSLLGTDPVVIAGLNAPEKTVVSGPADAVARVVARAEAAGVRAARLRVSHAFHSPDMAAAADPLARHLDGETIAPTVRTMISTVTGAPLAAGADVRAILRRQLTEPVRFVEALSALGDVDLVIEVGPGRVLSGLAAHTLSAPIVATDGGGPSLTGVLEAIGAAWALGADVSHAALHAGRVTRPFDPDRVRGFLRNPCEDAPVSETADVAPEAAPERPAPVVPSPGGSLDDAASLVRALVAERAELPRDAVRLGDHLLEDLHLNSITVGQLAVDAAARLGLRAPIAPNELASATVGELAQAIEALGPRGKGAGDRRLDGPPPGVDSWVRPFACVHVEAPLAGSRGESGAVDGPPRDRWVVLGDDDACSRSIEALADRWPGRGVAVVSGERSGVPIERLLEGARLVSAAGGGRDRFVLVEHRETRASGASFAKTLHLERPGVRVAVIGVDPEGTEAARFVSEEIACAGRFVEARIGANGAREIPRLVAMDAPSERGDLARVLSQDDVILVTGGGKGIAAECARAIARATGARLGLLGRSDPWTDAELGDNLARLGREGVVHAYEAADVTEPSGVHEAIRRLAGALGPITGILHGAGSNVPKRIEDLDARTIRATIAPKLAGADHVFAAVDHRRLRLLVTFGSVIARAGMAGEADYAMANDHLAAWTRARAAEIPGCKTTCVEWSVWSGVGMAERLGRVDALARQGIMPIPPDAGVGALVELLDRDVVPPVVVVSGRLGAAPTVAFGGGELPLGRFLERPSVYVPGVELVAEADLSVDTDPYLEDHVVDGERILPAVLGLEAMAQLAGALVPGRAIAAFEDVRFQRALGVPAHGSRTVRVAALRSGSEVVDVVIRSDETDFQIDHFRASCRFAGAGANAEPPAAAGPPDGREAPGVSLDPRRDLYEHVLFQRGRFQRLEGYRALSATDVDARISRDGDARWFGRYLPSELLLGDPGARDAALHAIQACVPHARILPVGVERIVVSSIDPEARVSARARERSRDRDAYVYDMEILDGAGRTLERWEGLRLARVGALAAPENWRVPLLETFVERRVQELVPGSDVRVRLGPATARGGESDAVLARALGPGAVVHRRSDGKPVVSGEDAFVSVSHGASLTMAAASRARIGCDVETITPRDRSSWSDLLGADRLALADAIVRESADDVDAASTRVWSAIECLEKAGVPRATPLVLVEARPDGWVVLGAGDGRVATGLVQTLESDRPFVVAVLSRPPGAGERG